MTTTTFDTLQYAKKLKESGFTEQQAETQAETLKQLADTINNNLSTHVATKSDIELLRRDAKADIELLRKDMSSLKNELIIKVGGMLVVAVGVLAAIIKL